MNIELENATVATFKPEARRALKSEKDQINNNDSQDKSDLRLRELGYAPQFKRNMSFGGVIGLSFWWVFQLRYYVYCITMQHLYYLYCINSAIGILTGKIAATHGFHITSY